MAWGQPFCPAFFQDCEFSPPFIYIASVKYNFIMFLQSLLFSGLYKFSSSPSFHNLPSNPLASLLIFLHFLHIMHRYTPFCRVKGYGKQKKCEQAKITLRREKNKKFLYFESKCMKTSLGKAHEKSHLERLWFLETISFLPQDRAF